MLFGSYCLGLKADVSRELDLTLVLWKSIDEILGSSFVFGVGADITEDYPVSDETEVGVKLIQNTEGEVVGAGLSLGVGEGPDLPLDWLEVSHDRCQTFEIWRINLKEIFVKIYQWIRSKLTVKKTIATFTHELSDI